MDDIKNTKVIKTSPSLAKQSLVDSYPYPEVSDSGSDSDFSPSKGKFVFLLNLIS